MPMTATSWTISCDTATCSSPWTSKSTPLAVKGDKRQAIAAAEKAGWRRCWYRHPKTGKRTVMGRGEAWWCPWHAQFVMQGEAEKDRKDAEFIRVVENAKREALSQPDNAGHPTEGP